MLLFNVYLINFLKFSPRRARSTRRKIIANDKTLLKMIQVYFARHALKRRDLRVLRGECVLFFDEAE